METVNLSLQLSRSAATVCSHHLLQTDPFILRLAVCPDKLTTTECRLGKNSSGCVSGRAFMAKDCFVF